ncbi:MAG: VOC family protein [Dehalococcoidia bacterium]
MTNYADGTSFRFHHIHLNTTNYEEAVDFYTRIMAGTIDHTGEWNGRRTAAIDLGGIRLLISDKAYPFVEIPDQTPDGPHFGLEHFCLTVPDLDAAVTSLKSRGAKFFMDIHVMRDKMRMAIVKAPDNVRIELFARS